MKAALRVQAGDRIMVFAPHPDDETLAAGDLIQTAVAVGATVRVLFATDGDNNPWPQRWLEKRWRIGAAERTRWGMRRRREAGAALATFGVDATTSARFLGWPDQGLTDLLMRDEEAVATLAQELVRFAPSHVVMPVLVDRHPDHSALRVLVELALLRSGIACQRLGFLVHGEPGSASIPAMRIEPPPTRLKTRALEAHASQVALSRRRLLAIANAPESYHVGAAGGEAVESMPEMIRIPFPADAASRPHRLLLVIAGANRIQRFSAPLPRRSAGSARIGDDAGAALDVEWSADELQVRLPRFDAPLRAIYAKLDRRAPRVVIFDRTRWLDLGSLRTDAVVASGIARDAVSGPA